MKKTIFSMLAVASLIFSSCSTSKQVTADESADIAKITGKKWQLVELGGKPVAAEVNGKMPYLEFLHEAGRYSANGGCNTLNGEFQFAKNNKIHFTRGISTMMACENMEIERGLGQSLQQADNYTFANGMLSLNQGRKAPLARFKEISADVSVAGTWELDYIAGSNKPFNELFPGKKPTMVIQAGSSKVSGNGGCNNYGSNMSLDGRKVSFSGIFSTKMGCPGEGEPLYFSTLEKVNVMSVNGDAMTLIIGDIAVMRFKRK